MQPRLWTERILYGEGYELLDVGHQSIRLKGANVHLIFALHYNDKNYKVIFGLELKYSKFCTSLYTFGTDWKER